MANFGDEARRIARGEKRSWDYDMMIEEINCGARNENPGRRFAIESLLALASDGRGGGGRRLFGGNYANIFSSSLFLGLRYEGRISWWGRPARVTAIDMSGWDE